MIIATSGFPSEPPSQPPGDAASQPPGDPPSGPQLSDRQSEAFAVSAALAYLRVCNDALENQGVADVFHDAAEAPELHYKMEQGLVQACDLLGAFFAANQDFARASNHAPCPISAYHAAKQAHPDSQPLGEGAVSQPPDGSEALPTDGAQPLWPFPGLPPKAKPETPQPKDPPKDPPKDKEGE